MQTISLPSVGEVTYRPLSADELGRFMAAADAAEDAAGLMAAFFAGLAGAVISPDPLTLDRLSDEDAERLGAAISEATERAGVMRELEAGQ